MTPSAVHLFALLFGAHVLGDFVLQTASDVRRKREPVVLFKHCAIHAVLAVLVTGGIRHWQIPVVVLTSHAALDYTKARWGGASAMAFLADQLGHLACAALLAIQVTHGRALELGWGTELGVGADYARAIAWVAGLIAAMRAGRFFMALFVRPYLAQIDAAAATTASPRPEALRDAGKTIGELERLLIFVLVLADQAAAVGFLIAAKSVFRFGELKEPTRRMESEYIIIGTLASFAYAMCVALGTRALLRSL